MSSVNSACTKFLGMGLGQWCIVFLVLFIGVCIGLSSVDAIGDNMDNETGDFEISYEDNEISYETNETISEQITCNIDSMKNVRHCILSFLESIGMSKNNFLVFLMVIAGIILIMQLSDLGPFKK